MQNNNTPYKQAYEPFEYWTTVGWDTIKDEPIDELWRATGLIRQGPNGPEGLLQRLSGETREVIEELWFEDEIPEDEIP